MLKCEKMRQEQQELSMEWKERTTMLHEDLQMKLLQRAELVGFREELDSEYEDYKKVHGKELHEFI